MNHVCHVRRASVLLGALLVSGCSILPGLHIGGTASSKDAYEKVYEQGGVAEYVSLRGGRTSGYRVVTVSQQTLAEVRISTDMIIPPTPQALESQIGQGQAEYRIGPGDVVLVTVWDHPELSAPLGDRSDVQAAGRLVSTSGTMFYPYVGEFKVAGMTVLEVREYLRQRLSRVINNPQVDARVVAFRSQRVQVTGDVNNPGVVTLDDTDKGVLEAIAERGGLSERASRRRAILTRDGQAWPLDLAGMLSGNRPMVNTRLVAGDVIHVPDQSNDLVFVLGEVDKQSQVVLQQGKTTLTEALAQSGGLDKLRADDAGVLVFRRPFAEGTNPTIFSLDMSSPVGMLLAGEFVLQPRDVVYIKATDFAKYNSVIGQLLPTISAVFQIDRLVN